MKQLAVATILFATLTAAAGAATPAEIPIDATLICRTATSAEHANAQLKSPATDLICKPVSIAMKMSDGTMHVIGNTSVSSTLLGPDITRSVTPQQINDSWIRYVESTFHIERSGG